MRRITRLEWPGKPVRDGNTHLVESETSQFSVGMAWEARSGWKQRSGYLVIEHAGCWNGLGSPFGMETQTRLDRISDKASLEWPGKPVRDGNVVLPYYLQLAPRLEWPG